MAGRFSVGSAGISAPPARLAEADPEDLNERQETPLK